MGLLYLAPGVFGVLDGLLLMEVAIFDDLDCHGNQEFLFDVAGFE